MSKIPVSMGNITVCVFNLFPDLQGLLLKHWPNQLCDGVDVDCVYLALVQRVPFYQPEPQTEAQNVHACTN